MGPGGREIPLPCRVPELLQVAQPHAPQGLVSPAAWARLGRIADPLPPVAAVGTLECRLEAAAGQVDFQTCIRLTGGGRRRLARALEEAPLQEAVAGSVRWRRVYEFLRRWVDPGSAVYHDIPVVWLEFDVPEEDASPPEPFLFFTLDPERFYAPGVADPTALRATLRACLEPLGETQDPSSATALERCLHELPCCAQLLHGAVRPTPADSVVRLVVRLPWRELPGLLSRLGWSGSTAELRAHLERLCATTLVHSIHLDVGDRLGPRVGIEFYHPTSPREDRRWTSLFDELERSNACTPEKRSLLAGWRSSASEGATETGTLRVHRELLVKVTHDPGMPLRAKAYLPFGLRLRLAARAHRARRRSRASPHRA